MLTTTKQIMPYYSKISDLIIEEDFKSYNKILNNIKINEIHETLVLSLLRVSYLKRKKISSWNNFLDEVKIDFHDRGHDINKLLIGLI